MSYTVDQAQRMVRISALIVAGIYFYRRFTSAKPPASLLRQLPELSPKGQQLQPLKPIPLPKGLLRPGQQGDQVAPLGQFIVGWGFLYLTLSALAPSAPGFAGNTALLIIIGDLLVNGVKVSQALQKSLGGQEPRAAERAPRQNRGPESSEPATLDNSNQERSV